MKIYMMVGNIGSGKSTYIKNNLITPDCSISKDNIREELGGCIGVPYVWRKDIESLVDIIAKSIFESLLILQTKIIVLDGTFMTKNSRREAIIMAKEYGREIRCVVFDDRGEKVHVDRRMNDDRGFDRAYWVRVYNKMKESYDAPTEYEGFKRIIYKG